MHRLTTYLKRFWHFIWHSNSIGSWIANIVLAILIVKFILYPGFSALFQTTHPVVAVISESMEHDMDFDTWYEKNRDFYATYNITKDQFRDFPLHQGFNKGDLIVVFGYDDTPTVGDVVVFWAGENYPIIHRVIDRRNTSEDLVYTTKGDNNNRPIVYYVNRLGQPVPRDAPHAIPILDEEAVQQEDIIGKGIFRIPFLGNLKIWFVEGLRNLFEKL